MVDHNALSPSGKVEKASKFAAESLAGIIPGVGGMLSAAINAYSDSQQEKAFAFIQSWMSMITDEIVEKGKTVLEIMARVDIQDEKINERITTAEFQSLLKKAFREWGAAESEEKRVYIRNILSNSAVKTEYSYDVIKMFLDWIKTYSEMHFKVITAIYNSNGISRGEIWDKMGRKQVREDSAEADLYKLIIRDLSTGGIIRQHKDTDFHGNFIKQKSSPATHNTSNVMKSAFDRIEKYELTNLGNDFIHYAMTDVPVKIEFKSAAKEAYSDAH